MMAGIVNSRKTRLTKGRPFVSGTLGLYRLVITVLDLLPKRLFTKGVDSAYLHRRRGSTQDRNIE